MRCAHDVDNLPVVFQVLEDLVWRRGRRERE